MQIDVGQSENSRGTTQTRDQDLGTDRGPANTEKSETLLPRYDAPFWTIVSRISLHRLFSALRNMPELRTDQEVSLGEVIEMPSAACITTMKSVA